MTFSNSKELKNYILKKGERAIAQAQEQVYLVINRFLKEYYAEFNPSLYERTYQLFQSLVKTNVKQVGNGVYAEVYFDLDALDYHMKRLHGHEIANKGWSEEKTLEAAMTGGTHGGYRAESNTEVWTESLSVLGTEGYNILRRALIQNGIPVR